MLKDKPRTRSAAFPDHASTVIGAFLEKAAANQSNQSGFAIVPDGRQAFTSRIAMTELAEKTLDLQYFVWDPDATGRILAEHLVHAADRGVRVRILIDDIYTKGSDAILSALEAHPNIEVRLFNPFAHRSRRMLDFIVDFSRVNHRTHNKLFVMDNTFGIALLLGALCLPTLGLDVHVPVAVAVSMLSLWMLSAGVWLLRIKRG